MRPAESLVQCMKATFVVALFVLGTAADACAVCGQALPQAQTAYEIMSVIISLLPLGMIGGIIFYMVWRIKAADKGEIHNREIENVIHAPPNGP